MRAVKGRSGTVEPWYIQNSRTQEGYRETGGGQCGSGETRGLVFSEQAEAFRELGLWINGTTTVLSKLGMDM